ncbi:unnamed protein product [marine sediment metagenome]|uniref:Uncharacterized protein n=1 Tax=marine sediment metagenome TaxID=412755 RepID=X1IAM8_9ZZZZ
MSRLRIMECEKCGKRVKLAMFGSHMMCCGKTMKILGFVKDTSLRITEGLNPEKWIKGLTEKDFE